MPSATGMGAFCTFCVCSDFTMSTGTGRSSSRNLPYRKIDRRIFLLIRNSCDARGPEGKTCFDKCTLPCGARSDVLDLSDFICLVKKRVLS
jgi:hypothetical protein